MDEPKFEDTKFDLREKFKVFSDDDLLLELRRRGRIGRVDYHTIAPSYAVQAGYPLEEQLIETYRHLGNALLRKAHPMPGFKNENGNFLDAFPYPASAKDRKVTVVLNFILDKPK